ncbi:hypothetical protein MKW98_016260 [Papaver atlanticum]|uniref:Uncharacterized protein n=1 Tax=Papaver atlanticum TaxID=357466 RepID=A0AAD4SJT8_9MAGN|nr:hypothetical protein MKW98_016260 [Papaver atlanticum]
MSQKPSYKDTIEGDGSNFLDNLKVLTGSLDNCVEKTTPNGRCVVGMHVVKLPPALTKLLDGSSDLLGEILDGLENLGRIMLRVKSSTRIMLINVEMCGFSCSGESRLVGPVFFLFQKPKKRMMTIQF